MWMILKNLLLLVLMLHDFQSITIASSNVKLGKKNNKEYEGDKLDEIHKITMTTCLEHCLANCLCKSFEMCNNTICRLISSTGKLDSSKLKHSNHCDYFEFKQNHSQQCDRNSCMYVINCCLTSNPCKNGGTCLPSNNNEERFHCKCAKNYEGKYCKKFYPKTCKDQSNNRNKTDGEYMLYLKMPTCNQTAKIYCADMNTSTPLEYVTLSAINFNYAYDGIKNITFKKIRLNVTSMEVLRKDYKFATPNVSDDFHGFASANNTRHFAVDLTGTSFRLQQSIAYHFVPTNCNAEVDYPTKHGNADRLQLSGHCGYNCSFCFPKELLLKVDRC